MNDEVGVLVVERKAVIRRGLVTRLDGVPGVRVVGSAGTTAAGCHCAAVRPDAPGLAAARPTSAGSSRRTG